MTTALINRCKRCKSPIELRNYGSKNWEPDYDPDDDPVVWRHANGYAACGMSMSGAAAPLLPTKIEYVYVASSWRCLMQDAVCTILAAAGIEHYDFKNPHGGAGFKWTDVGLPAGDGGSSPPTVEQYLESLQHPRAIKGFEADFAAMERADTFVLVLPCNRSAHLELGWAVGQGKRTCVLLEDPVTPELMYRLVDHLSPNVGDLLEWLGVEN